MRSNRPANTNSQWEAAVSGDADAFAAIYDQHRDRVFGHAIRLVRNHHDVEDVTALVFLEAWRLRQRVRVVDDSILPWLFVTTNFVVRNFTRTARRHRAAMAKLPADLEPDDGITVIDSAIDSQGQRSQVRLAFAALSQRDQDALMLCVLEALSMREAAAALRVPEGTVKSRQARAKERLATALDAEPNDSLMFGARS